MSFNQILNTAIEKSALLKIAFFFFTRWTLKSKFYFFLLAISQVVLGFIELFVLGGIALITSISIRGLNDSAPGNLGSAILGSLNISDIGVRFQILILAVCVIIGIVVKLIMSILLAVRTNIFLRDNYLVFLRDVVNKGLSSLDELQSKHSEERLRFALLDGTQVSVVSVMGALLQILSNAATVIFIFASMVIVDYKMAIFLVTILVLNVVLQYKFFGKKAREHSSKLATAEIQCRTLFTDTSNLYREFKALAEVNSQVDRLVKSKQRAVTAQNYRNLLNVFSTSAFELVLYSTSLLMLLYQVATNEISRALAIFSLFLAGSLRMAPAFLRIYSNIILIRSDLTYSAPLFSIISDVENLNKSENYQMSDLNMIPLESEGKLGSRSIQPIVSFHSVNFGFPNSHKPILNKVSFEVNVGDRVKVEGRSGVGKSTIIDLILGIKKPSMGSINIAGYIPEQLFSRKPGWVSYVPQVTHTISGDVFSNVALGVATEKVDKGFVEELLVLSGLGPRFQELKEIEGTSGGLKSKLSGGELQRLALIRALYTHPKLLLLDEVTSALDNDNKFKILQLLKSLPRDVTIIAIEHGNVLNPIFNKRLKVDTNNVFMERIPNL